MGVLAGELGLEQNYYSPGFPDGASAIERRGSRSSLFRLVGGVHNAFGIVFIRDRRREGHAVIV